MTKSFSLLLAAACLSGTVLARADDRTEIAKRYEFLNHAYLTKNEAAIGSLFDKSCIVRLDGEITKMAAPVWVKYVASSMRIITVESSKVRVLTFKPVKDGIQTTAETKGSYRLPSSKPSEKKKFQVVKSKQLVKDTWKKTAQGWKIFARAVMKDD